MAPRKRSNAGSGNGTPGPAKPAKAKRTSEDLEKLSQEAVARNPHVKMMDVWLHL